MRQTLESPGAQPNFEHNGNSSVYRTDLLSTVKLRSHTMKSLKAIANALVYFIV